MNPKFLTGAISVFAFQGIGMALMFSRNVLLARMLPVEDMAIVALIGLTIGIVELFGEIGLAKFLMQSTEQNEYASLACVHAICIGRGVIYGAILFLLAGVWAKVLGVPAQTWVFAATAVVPVIRGMTHYDVFLQQRDLSFRSANWMEVASQGLAILAAFLVAAICHSYFAGFTAVVMHTTSLAVTSHLLATKKYEVHWDATIGKRIIRFGLPLLADCILIGFIINADRFLVAISGSISRENRFSLAEVSVYCLAFGLSYAAALIIHKACSTVFNPLLLKARANEQLFDRRLTQVCETTVVLAIFLVMLLGVYGQSIFGRLYGANYPVPPGLLESFSLAFACRLIRLVPEVGTYALGRNQELLFMNFVRFLGIAMIPPAIFWGHGLAGVAVACVLAEICSSAFAFSRLTFLLSSAKRMVPIYKRLAFGALTSGLILLMKTRFVTPEHDIGFVLLTVLVLLLSVAAFPSTRNGARAIAEKVGVRLGFLAESPPTGLDK